MEELTWHLSLLFTVIIFLIGFYYLQIYISYYVGILDILENGKYNHKIEQILLFLCLV